jgi:hypothetical protein
MQGCGGLWRTRWFGLRGRLTLTVEAVASAAAVAGQVVTYMCIIILCFDHEHHIE